MAILTECPFCHRHQAVKAKVQKWECCNCSRDLLKEKKAQRLTYFIHYRVKGKQNKERVGNSYEDAKAAEGKRRSQKKENRIFDILPGTNLSFKELSEWYLNLSPVRSLASYDRVEQALTNFNITFGDRLVVNLKPLDLQEYQNLREKQGYAPATIDMEVSIAKTMVTKAFDNDQIDGRAVKAFRSIKKKLKKAGNARKRTLSIAEYIKLTGVALKHLRPVLITAYNTGMRSGELRLLQWSHIDRKRQFIRLPVEVTKERKKKVIPINHHVRDVLDDILSPKVVRIGNLAGSALEEDDQDLQRIKN